MTNLQLIDFLKYFFISHAKSCLKKSTEPRKKKALNYTTGDLEEELSFTIPTSSTSIPVHPLQQQLETLKQNLEVLRKKLATLAGQLSNLKEMLSGCSIGGAKKIYITVVVGEIATQQFLNGKQAAIVNAANTGLWGGAGIALAIQQAFHTEKQPTNGIVMNLISLLQLIHRH